MVDLLKLEAALKKHISGAVSVTHVAYLYLLATNERVTLKGLPKWIGVYNSTRNIKLGELLVNDLVRNDDDGFFLSSKGARVVHDNFNIIERVASVHALADVEVSKLTLNDILFYLTIKDDFPYVRGGVKEMSPITKLCNAGIIKHHTARRIDGKYDKGKRGDVVEWIITNNFATYHIRLGNVEGAMRRTNITVEL